jgi:hypothetical protein
MFRATHRSSSGAQNCNCSLWFYIRLFIFFLLLSDISSVYLYLETALHVSGGTFARHQERIQLYLQHLLFVTPLLLSAAIVEELELV